MTADVDITVELGAATPVELLAALAKAGFPTRLSLTDAFVAEARLFPLVHQISTIPIDLLLAGTGLHAEFLERRRHVDVEGVLVPMLSPEDLIITKVLAGRRKDLEDVRGVLAEQGAAIDATRVREVLTGAEEALERPGLMRRFDRLLRGTRSTTWV